MEILFLIALILLNGLFAMSEIALITAKKSRLTRLAEEGDSRAAAAIRLGEEPTRFLSTIQIGITSISILNGIVGEAVLAAPLAAWVEQYGLDKETSHVVATAMVVVVITYVSIVVGELVPKRIAQVDPEGIARLVARPMRMLAVATHPFVRLLAFSTESLLRLLGLRNAGAQGVTEEEIHALLQEGSDAGVIERHEHEMVRNVFRLDERQIGSLMIPRSNIVYIDLEQPLEANLEYVAASEHSRFPVCRGGLHDIIGVIPAKDLFYQMHRTGTVELTPDHFQPCVYVPETLTGMALLDQFRVSGTHMVFVIDEFGEIQGLVTLQDVLEAVTGEFNPHDDEEAWATQREDGSWLLDGIIPIPELKDRLGFKAVPEEEKGRYHTLSGMMMWLLGRIPRTSDLAEWEGWRLEVVDLDGRRVDKVLASRIPEPAQPPEPGQAE